MEVKKLKVSCMAKAINMQTREKVMWKSSAMAITNKLKITPGNKRELAIKIGLMCLSFTVYHQVGSCNIGR
jgi:hypothetical protein